jgi:hypothetical protein
MISNRQFGEAASDLQNEGGFSRSARTGRRAKSGWMVSRKSDTNMTPIDPSTANGPGLKSAYKANRGAMIREGHMGGWVNPQGSGDVEPSRRYKDSTRGFFKAQGQMHEHNQEAMFNPGNGRTYHNALHPANANMSGAQFAENRSTLQDWAAARLRKVDPELAAKRDRIVRLHAPLQSA